MFSVRNNKIDYVYSVSLKLAAVENLELSVERILEYAFSHNVQQLSISIWNREIPPSRLKSKSLKHLTMIGTTLDCSSSPLGSPGFNYITPPPCQIVYLQFYFSLVTKLEESYLRAILTLKKVEWFVDFVYLDTPQLKNLTFVDIPQQEKYCTRELEEYYNYNQEIISEFSDELTISAHDLTYLCIKGSYFPKLSLDGFPSLEKLDLWTGIAN
ncbi:hypothetical protein Tco_0100112 [Tanacetum coccineum]